MKLKRIIKGVVHVVMQGGGGKLHAKVVGGGNRDYYRSSCLDSYLILIIESLSYNLWGKLLPKGRGRRGENKYKYKYYFMY